jgi:predicted metal-binding protein
VPGTLNFEKIKNEVNKMDRAKIEKKFVNTQFADFKWVNGNQISVAQWVRVKCMYGCDSYGKKSTCPPNTPSITECREFIAEYKNAVVFHFQVKVDDDKELHQWCKQINRELLKVEKEIFLLGYYKAFALLVDECNFCSDCVPERVMCKNKKMARPCTEAMGIDVYKTVRDLQYPIQVIREKNENMNRYGILLID